MRISIRPPPPAASTLKKPGSQVDSEDWTTSSAWRAWSCSRPQRERDTNQSPQLFSVCQAKQDTVIKILGESLANQVENTFCINMDQISYYLCEEARKPFVGCQGAHIFPTLPYLKAKSDPIVPLWRTGSFQLQVFLIKMCTHLCWSCRFSSTNFNE